ncbi:hypothetical protein AN642_02515 [Epulopiscium sp. SCG-B10WGA-EpuloA2]|nr:hypothetical protein AN642_02515 [Epulopiscium sp. SCG-B10WGA-EpuloA2]
MATDVLILVLCRDDRDERLLPDNINDYPPRTELENIVVGKNEKVALIELDIDYLNKEIPKFDQGNKFIFSFDWYKQKYCHLVDSRVLS